MGVAIVAQCSGCRTQRQSQSEVHEVRVATLESVSSASANMHVKLHEVEVVALRHTGDTVLLRAAQAEICQSDTASVTVRAVTECSSTQTSSTAVDSRALSTFPYFVLGILLCVIILNLWRFIGVFKGKRNN